MLSMSNVELIKIAIVDDQQLVRSGISKLLTEYRDRIEVVFEAENGQQFLDLFAKHPVDVVLLDIEMPILNGFRTYKKIIQEELPVKVIMLSMHDDFEIAFKMLKDGVGAYLLKNCSTAEMVEAIEQVHKNGRFLNAFSEKAIFSGHDEQEKADRFRMKNELSPRDFKVLMLICDGLKSEDIAKQIDTSKKTVDLTRTKLMKAFDVKTGNALMRECILKGFYKPRTDQEIKDDIDAFEVSRRERRMVRLRGEY